MRRPRILVAPLSIQPPGGGSAVGAWTVQALREAHELTVLTWEPVDLEEVNQAFGTSLARSDAEWITLPRLPTALIDAVPARLELLRSSVNMRAVRQLLQRRSFDASIGMHNEIWAGQPVIQYIHYPWAGVERAGEDQPWFRPRIAVQAYHHLSRRLSGYDAARIADNFTLVNSAWTGRAYERMYGLESEVLYPPVPGNRFAKPFAQRQPRFATLGRIAPEKRLEDVVELVSAVRARGHDVGLSIVGHVCDSAYARRIRRLARAHASWLSLHTDLGREALEALMSSHRYAIHGMHGEHFGIAPAELQRSGCITFVTDEGGTTEVVDHDQRVIYSSLQDGVHKICRVLEDEAFERELARDVQARAETYSEERYMVEVRALVAEFLARGVRSGRAS